PRPHRAVRLHDEVVGRCARRGRHHAAARTEADDLDRTGGDAAVGEETELPSPVSAPDLYVRGRRTGSNENSGSKNCDGKHQRNRSLQSKRTSDSHLTSSALRSAPDPEARDVLHKLLTGPEIMMRSRF